MLTIKIINKVGIKNILVNNAPSEYSNTKHTSLGKHCLLSVLHNLTFSYVIVHHSHLLMLRNIIIFLINKQHLKYLENFTEDSSMICKQ